MISTTNKQSILANLLNAFQKQKLHAWASMLCISLLTVFVPVLNGCSNYDELVQKDAECDRKWADVDATLQRRYDLIPNLVATVKAQANFEQNTLENVTKARAEAVSIKMSAEMLSDPEAMRKFSAAQEQLKGSLSRLLAVAENYPQLKATDGFRGLQTQLEGTENRILRAREEYNRVVSEYNAALGKVRGKVVNKVTGNPFKPRVYFKADTAAATAPKVSF